jgi:DNA-binding NarL/FixJ family response regulator
MTVLIADDHPLTLFGTANYVISLGYKVCEMCNNGINALNAINALTPDIALLDVNMPGLDGIEISERIQKFRIKTKVVLLTMHNERSLYAKAIEYGVYGYLLKNFSSEELEACLKTVSLNKHYVSSHLASELISTEVLQNDNRIDNLTFTERKVLELISQQKNTRQIAQLLFTSEKTIEGHRRNIIDKLKLPKEKNQLLMWALQNKELLVMK